MPREDVTVMETISSGSEDMKNKIVRLTAQLAEAEGQKKSAMKGFNDAIKDLKEEIKLTMELIKDQDGE